MIVDYDAHHGNGTQAAFLNEGRVAFLSTHQWEIYPGTAWITDSPHAKKRIVNVPLPAHAGDGCYARIADEIIEPFVENFKPQMIFVSAGFDAHWSDPITTLGLSTTGYFNISKKLVALAEEHCDGKIIFVLEGGYDPITSPTGLRRSSLRWQTQDRAPKRMTQIHSANPTANCAYEAGDSAVGVWINTLVCPLGRQCIIRHQNVRSIVIIEQSSRPGGRRR